MGRLTKRLQEGKALCIEECEKECVEGYYECHKCKPFADVLKKLADYEDAEEQGLLIKLPCPVGSEVWKIVNQRDNFSDIPYKIATRTNFRLDMLNEIGKTVFITEKEANNTLAELSN